MGNTITFDGCATKAARLRSELRGRIRFSYFDNVIYYTAEVMGIVAIVGSEAKYVAPVVVGGLIYALARKLNDETFRTRENAREALSKLESGEIVE